MNNKLKSFKFKNFELNSGKKVSVNLTYQVFGLTVNEGPVVVVNHSLTGDSNVCGSLGWWSELVGYNKMIDTGKFSVICINIPGNIIEGKSFDYENDWILSDVAKLFTSLLENLGIVKVHSVIGGSIGGGLVWEMAFLKPSYYENLIPIAADYKSSDWLISNTFLQQQILKNSREPVKDARIHAMLTYRNPKSFNIKFNLGLDNFNQRKVINWLNYHGEELKKNLSLEAYIHMNNLLSSIGINYKSRNDFKILAEKISAKIHLVGINTDLLFPNFEIQKSFIFFSGIGKDISFHEIESDHGHDAFLIEFEKMHRQINKIFQI